MKIKKEFIKREIAGENILVPTGETSLKFNGLITLNDVASFIWDKLPVVETDKDLVKLILDEYEIDEDTASKDVAEFLEKLKKAEII